MVRRNNATMLLGTVVGQVRCETPECPMHLSFDLSKTIGDFDQGNQPRFSRRESYWKTRHGALEPKWPSKATQRPPILGTKLCFPKATQVCPHRCSLRRMYRSNFGKR